MEHFPPAHGVLPRTGAAAILSPISPSTAVANLLKKVGWAEFVSTIIEFTTFAKGLLDPPTCFHDWPRKFTRT